jgi:hypothetical protein
VSVLRDWNESHSCDYVLILLILRFVSCFDSELIGCTLIHQIKICDFNAHNRQFSLTAHN